ncbi:MAG: glycosyl transferase, partial [SAR324 cluster bacterium]|nr:glycosyl transferase [SAR324 cluster bacterium]
DGWDGNWYRRAYFDNGVRFGSAENEECRIDSLTQSWAVISGMSNPQRAHVAMQQVYEQLVDNEHKLIRLLTPPFDKGELRPGYIKGYLPGIRENGAQYTHAAAWVVIAAAILGQGKQAVSLFNMINPINHSDNPEQVSIYRGEPYVMCGDVYSMFPYAGRAGWSWYTGSAGWMYQAGLEHILGLKVMPGGFTVDPCVDPSWKQFQIQLKRGNVVYSIEVQNPRGIEKGVEEIRLDGEILKDLLIPIIDSTMMVTKEVRVRMG